jgi:hypothetical protein
MIAIFFWGGGVMYHFNCLDYSRRLVLSCEDVSYSNICSADRELDVVAGGPSAARGASEEHLRDDRDRGRDQVRHVRQPTTPSQQQLFFLHRSSQEKNLFISEEDYSRVDRVLFQ